MEHQSQNLRFLVEEYTRQGASKKNSSLRFRIILASMLSLSLTGGVLLSHVKISEIQATHYLKKMDVSFFLKEKPTPKKVEKPKPPAKPKKVEIKKASLKEEVKTAALLTPKPVRKVYGVRKVYSRGLGSGTGGGDAVVAKLGNSLDVPLDTILATQDDLKGSLVSVTRISRMPQIRFSVKPDYTSEMKQNNVTGKVKARVLVDVDGRAKKIIILEDLGFGTRQSSIDAIQKMTFDPGLLDDAPVAVWIPLTFRFELQA